MEKTLTPEERIAIISYAHKNSQSFAPKQSVKDFVADVKSEEVFSEHGLLDNQKADLEDESQFLNSDSAEEIEEEDESLGLSDEMRESIGVSIKIDDQLEFDKNAMFLMGNPNDRPKSDKEWRQFKNKGTAL